jgi:hypothetical protein
VVRVFLVVQFAYFQSGVVARCEGSFHLRREDNDNGSIVGL